MIVSQCASIFFQLWLSSFYRVALALMCTGVTDSFLHSFLRSFFCASWHSTTKNFPYLFWVLAWLTVWTFGGAVGLFLIEEGRYSYFRCFFLACASTTSGGLSIINVPALTSQSLTLLTFLSLAGSSIMLTLLPVSRKGDGVYKREQEIDRRLEGFCRKE